ncbi:MAG: hypothetical protein GXZ05_08140 [Gammaproteobacteria bacterium]|nr:hypothetical protein [Gammaproteobacteria bacterium]
MAIKIHYGPNGSYKTSGALQDDAVPALLSGRVIVTNIRGFTLDRAYQVFPDLPETAMIINLDLENLEDLEKMRTWFIWAPLGAFIIFDEAQLLFPKSWRDKDLERFDYPGGMEAAKEANRPFNWLDAWTRHRHFGFDIVLTTPNISYIRDDIRSTCETAYRHANLAVIGISGRYKEAQHDAQLNRPPADGSIIEYKRIKQQTFDLYSSTATGQVRDTFAGKSLFRSPKLLIFVAVIAYAIYSVFATSGDTTFFSASSKPVPVADQTPVEVVASPAGSGTAAASGFRVSDLPGKSRDSADPVNHPFAGHDIKIVARLYSPTKQTYAFEFKDAEGRTFLQSSTQLLGTGYTLSRGSDCFVLLTYGNAQIPVTCRGAIPGTQPKPEAIAYQEPPKKSPLDDYLESRRGYPLHGQ